ncbi:MAG: alpha/beta hydrolase [Clostridia bacterium]|nr:alpha/beta hydrolase [Clostridia bacterium]
MKYKGFEMGKYAIKKEFSPYHRFTPPIRNAKIAGLMGSCMRPPRWIRRDKDVRVNDEVFSGFNGDSVKLMVIRPRGVENMSNFGELPSLVYFHGGGFFFEGANYHYKLAKSYAVKACCKVIFVHYRLSPKHPFPTAVEDCYAALQWTYDNSYRLGIDPGRIAVGGDSAGGALAAAVCLMSRDRGGVKPLFQLLVYPVTDRRMDTASNRLYTDTPMWNSTLSRRMWDAYLVNVNQPECSSVKIAYASPMEADNLADLPDAYVETAEFDCLRDEGIAYADALERAGTAVERYSTEGTMHGFDIAWKAETTQCAVARRIEYMTRQFATRRFV